MKLFQKWRSDEGSLDFIQVITGLVIIAIAAITTIDGLGQGYGWLDYQNRHTKAVAIARSYMEYLQGRIHTDFDPAGRFEDAQLMQGNKRAPVTVLLDGRDPANPNDNVECKVHHGPLLPIDQPQTGTGIDFWKIRVHVEWNEPKSHSMFEKHSVFFESAMISSGL